MILFIHLAGAAMTGVTILAAIFAIHMARNSEKYVKYLGILTTFQLISGGALIVTDPSISVTRFCLSSTAYLAVVGVVSLLIRKQTILQRSRKLARN